MAMNLGGGRTPFQDRVSAVAVALLAPPPHSTLTLRVEELLTVPGMEPTPFSQDSIKPPSLPFNGDAEEHKSPGG